MKAAENKIKNSLHEKLIVALDTPSMDVVNKLLSELQGTVTYFKIGFELFTAHGWEAVAKVKKTGARIFLDLKLHDIPNTVSKTAAVICEHEIEMFNLHTLGGFEMMKKVRETVDLRAKNPAKKPLILGVTVLTSHSQEAFTKDLRIVHPIADQVTHLAALARKAGMDGVVSSPQEIEILRKDNPSPFLIVTPGIRGKDDAKGDQKRTFSAVEAVKAGADYIVVGRPITEAENPRREAEAILASLDTIGRAS